MKYQKAAAKVIDFGKRDVFMIISSGGRCRAYGRIEDDFCYSFSITGSMNYDESWFPCTCGDYTGTPCGVVHCVTVDQPKDMIVP